MELSLEVETRDKEIGLSWSLNTAPMNRSILILLTFVSLFTATSAYAMSGPQAKHLYRMAAYKGSLADLATLEAAAHSGDAEAEYYLAEFDHYDYGAAPADVKNINTLFWLKKAAAQGLAGAENALAVAYYLGWGTQNNYAKAVYWWKKAANQGYAIAQNDLGWRYQEGHGVTKNYAKAVYWWKKAANQGYAKAEYNLGNDYQKGQGVTKNYAKAGRALE